MSFILPFSKNEFIKPNPETKDAYEKENGRILKKGSQKKEA